MGLPRQFSLLPHRHEADSEAMRGSRSENEPTGIDAHDLIDRTGRNVGQEVVDSRIEQPAVGQHRSDVLKLDSRLGKIRHVADRLFEFAQRGDGHALGLWTKEPSTSKPVPSIRQLEPV